RVRVEPAHLGDSDWRRDQLVRVVRALERADARLDETFGLFQRALPPPDHPQRVHAERLFRPEPLASGELSSLFETSLGEEQVVVRTRGSAGLVERTPLHALVADLLRDRLVLGLIR